MKTLQNIIATLAIATAAGCASSPSWPEPKVRDQPIYVAVQTTSEQPTETEQPVKPTETNVYKFTFSYPEFQSQIEAGLYEGIVQSKEKKENRKLTDLEKIKLAREIGGEDGINSDELNTHAKQTGEKIPFVYNASKKIGYESQEIEPSQKKRIEQLAGATLESRIKLGEELEKISGKIGQEQTDQLEYAITGKMPEKKPEQPKKPGEQSEKPVPQPGQPEQPESGYVTKTLVEKFIIADKDDDFKKRSFYSICGAVNRTDYADVAYEMDGLGDKDGKIGFEEHAKFLGLNNLKNYTRIKDIPEASELTRETAFSVEQSASKAYDSLIGGLTAYDKTRFRRIAEKLYGANPQLDAERIKELAKELK